MSHTQEIILSFVFFAALTVWCSYIGDDDIVYKFLDRKPTPQEGVIRIRFVILKTITSVYAGSLMSIWFVQYIKSIYLINLSKNQAVLLVLIFIAMSSLFIGIIQNGMRYLQCRPRRALIDTIIWRHNLRQWLRWFNRMD